MHIISLSKKSDRIDDLKKIIEELEESREKYRMIAEMSAVGIMIVQDREIIFANQWLADILEYSVEDILKWDLDRANQHVNQEDLKQIQNVQTTSFPNMDFRLISRTGKKYWIRQFSDKIRIGGKIADQIIILNITERVNMERELRDSMGKYRQLFEYSPTGILTCDKDGNILTFNERLLKILDLTSPEKTKQVNLFQFPELQTNGFAKQLAECIQNKVEINEEVVYTTDEGIKAYFQYKLVPFLNSERNTYEVLCNLNDITHIRQAQDEIRAKDILFQKMIDIAPYPIMICSLDGSVQYVNQKIYEISGISSFENIGLREISQMITIKKNNQIVNIDSLQEIWNDAMNTARVQEYTTDLTLQRSDNSSIELAFTLSLIDNQVILIFEDLTKRKQKEHDWLQMQKLESLSILAGGIAHDFNNILVGIVGNISLLQITDSLDSETKECLLDLEKATFRAKGLTNQLLTFAKGGKPIKKEDDIIPLMKQTIQLVTPGSKCKILFTIKEGNEGEVGESLIANMDSSQIQQVFNNLIINAMQAMPMGGDISISIEKCNTPLLETIPIIENGYGLISIRDQGHGIPIKLANRIFEPYFTTKDTGTGLGLASSHSIIRNHQGYINFTSESGKGTTFYIYLPLSSVKKSISSLARDKFPNYKSRALLIDDDEMVGKTIQKMLLKFGITSDIEIDGISAIETYKRAVETGHPYDFAIMDLTIPGSIGGKETFERLHAFDPNISAIVSSGYSENQIMSNYGEYGFKDVLVKPYNIEELRIKLKTLFS
ncbi:MAG: PAS domain-containing hybrid sensor histidine kinase/response regulator [Promethearchaeota archaeon]